MIKFRERVENSFFLIASDMDLSKVQSRLYGICYTWGGVYKDTNLSDSYITNINSEQSGCFIAVKNDGSRIVLEQDCCFSLYIYCYQNNEYWAISNSFWKLCDEVKKSYPLTLDEVYFEQFFSTSVTALSLKRTLANEIKVCPFGFNISIDIYKKTLKFDQNLKVLDQLTKKIPLDSPEGIKKMDGWISKWASIIRKIAHSGFEMKFDLTGGYDSRITFALAVASGIELNSSRVHIYSKKGIDKEGKLIEDYQIALQIAKEFGFNLSDQYSLESAKEIRGEAAYEIYRQVLSNVHREPYLPKYYYQKPIFYLNGLNGETVRGWRGKDEFIKSFKYPIGITSKRYYPVTAWKEIIDDWEELPIFSEDQQLNEVERNRYFYLAVRSRMHAATVMYQNNILNYWQVTNFADMDLLNIETPKGYNSAVIMAVILRRIDKRLLSVPISDNRYFSEEEIAYAEYIEQKYPVDIYVVEHEYEFFSDDLEVNCDINLNNNVTPEKLLYDRFLCEEGKKLFLTHFEDWGSMLYADAKDNHFHKDIKYSDQYIAAVGTVMEMLMIQNKSKRYYGNNMVRDDLHVLRALVKNFPENSTICDAYKKLCLAEKKQQIAWDEESDLNRKLQKTYAEKSELNRKLQKTYAEKSELNRKLQKTYAEKSELNRKLQITYKEKAERGLEIKRITSELNNLQEEIQRLRSCDE